MKKRIIWTEEIGELKNWADAIEDAGLSDADEYEQENYVRGLNADYLGDERMNLSRQLPGRVVCIADLGLWNGRRSGYRVLGTNLNSIFDVTISEMYCDAYNVCGTECHHDGTNYYTFRLIPDGVDATRLLDAIYDGEATSELIRRYTRSLRPYVSFVYGWGGRKLKGVA